MKFGLVDEHRHHWPIRVMCMVWLGLSVSGYYALALSGRKPACPRRSSVARGYQAGSMAKAAAPMARLVNRDPIPSGDLYPCQYSRLVEPIMVPSLMDIGFNLVNWTGRPEADPAKP